MEWTRAMGALLGFLWGNYIVQYQQCTIPWKPINMTQLWMNHN